MKGTMFGTRSRQADRLASTVVAAMLAALLGWAVVVPVAGVHLVAGTRPVGPGSVAVAALSSGIAAVLLRWALRSRPSGRTWWLGVAGSVLLVSLAGPVLSGATGTALVALESLHLLVGATLMVGVAGSWPRMPAGSPAGEPGGRRARRVR